MATELTAAEVERLKFKLEVGMANRTRLALQRVGSVVVKQARINASNGFHARGTPTPAQPGEGPARITSTVWRNIMKDRAVTVNGALFELRVGMRANVPHPNSKTTTSMVAYYLETGLRNGATYKFLGPAFKFAKSITADAIWAKTFSENWRTGL